MHEPSVSGADFRLCGHSDRVELLVPAAYIDHRQPGIDNRSVVGLFSHAPMMHLLLCVRLVALWTPTFPNYQYQCEISQARRLLN